MELKETKLTRFTQRTLFKDSNVFEISVQEQKKKNQQQHTP